MRLFVALDIDGPIRQRIARFMEGLSGFAPDVRWIPEESLHVNLKFIGESNQQREIQQALAGMPAAAPSVSFRGTGFFPTVNAARVFWVGIQADEGLGALAQSVDDVLLPLGIGKEPRAYSPHLTLARSGAGGRGRHSGRPGNNFLRLQEQLSKMPALEFGTMTPREFFLYASKTAPTGAVYTKLAAFPLAAAGQE